MRLHRCHIENFGKLHDFTIDFSSNPTVLTHENGWGKSTLATFIKVMFYGFDNERKRGDMLERERVRFKPWQGGVYGGELEFETGGKRYLLNRTFGSQEAEDTFALYDGATNLRSDDFSAHIGEELFQINRESFLRTIYIAQNDCVTQTTDSINAKMGNLADNLDDINRYEKVQQNLKALKNSLAPGRKTGALKKCRNEIDELKNELRKSELLERSIAELEEKLADCRRERESEQGRLERLKSEWTDANRYQEILAKREHYTHLLKQCGEKRTAVEESLKVFGGKAPIAERLQEVLMDQKEMIRQETEKQANFLEEEEKEELKAYRRRFASGLPDDAIFDQGRELAGELETMQTEEVRNNLSEEEQREIQRLDQRFLSGEVREEQIENCLEQWNIRMEKKSGLGTKKATLGSLRAMEEDADRKRKAPVSAGLFVLPILLVILGGILCAVKMVIGIFLVVAGVIGFVGLCVMHAAAGRKQEDETKESDAAILEREIAEDEATIERTTQKVQDFLKAVGIDIDGEDRGVQDMLYELREDLRRWKRLEAKRKDYEGKQYAERTADLRRQLAALLASFCTEQEFREKRVYELISDLEKWKKDFIRLDAKEKKYLDASKEYGVLRLSVMDFLAEHGREHEEDVDACLQYLSRRFSVYETDLEELAAAEEEQKEFERMVDVSSFEQIAEQSPRDVKEIEEEQHAAEEHLQQIGESIRSYVIQLDGREAEAEELELLQERLTELEEQYERDYRYYQNLELTGEYLARAKESFSAKYMGPIMSAFRQYLGWMSGENGEDFRMDANIRVTKREEGEQRDPRSFSAGNQDLIGLSLRMALIEAMYQKEKPFLIFDDSFANLDEEKLEHARQFLRKTAEKYQIIYFTCHGSRSL